MVNSTIVKSNLTLRYVSGQDANGKDKFKNQSFTNLKADAKPEDVYAVATAMGNMLAAGSAEIHRSDDALIINE